MKAILLSAGFGTRLRPLTDKTPKCLIKVKGLPILEHWLMKLELIKVTKVIVNTHYKREKVSEYLIKRPKSKMIIEESYEKKLLGTAGTLLANRKKLDNAEILFIHADNYTDEVLEGLIEAHKKRPSSCLMTMLTFKTDEPQRCGIVETDENGIVTSFYEKITNPPNNIANGAIYIFNNELIDYIFKHNPNAYDFSNDVIPLLLGRIYAYHIEEQYIDIGTPDSLKKANNF